MYKVYYYSGASTALNMMHIKEFSTLIDATTWANSQPVGSIIEIKHYENRTNNGPTLWR
jgi:hypothetical protein